MKTSTPSSRLLASIALAGSTLFAAATVQAQVLPAGASRHYNTFQVHLNAMNYFGDIVPKASFTSLRLGATRPNLGVALTHRYTPRISGRAMLSYGRISGDDQKAADKGDGDAVYRYNRNLSFRNDIIELSGTGIIELFENRGSYQKRRDFSPYVFLGVAVLHQNPKAQLNGKYVALQPLGTEGQFANDRAAKGYDKPYKRIQVAIPFGLGLEYKLTRQLNVGYEIGWRKTFTDYLDDVSGSYAAPADLSSTAAALADRSTAETKANPRFKNSYGIKGQQRGTDNEDDWYIVSGFHLSYIVVPTAKSPKFR